MRAIGLESFELRIKLCLVRLFERSKVCESECARAPIPQLILLGFDPIGEADNFSHYTRASFALW